jgi:phthiocerol/phenolphthiocerol synthesis type-I polyketide synthase C
MTVHAVSPLSPRRLAIVGMAYRFPGTAPDGFWNALVEGRNLVTTVDGARWCLETYHHPRESEPGRSYTFAAGSLGDVSGFDAAFFGISPREAAQMDPQQRLLLELAWEALESGGIRPSSLRGRHGGVFIGFSGSDYAYRHADDLASGDAFLMTGCTASIAANRISYFFDLRGPSMAIDTACSSALTAFHQACRAVLAGDAAFALAGAVNMLLHPLPFIAFSKASMLSRRGACRAFDAAGDGYVRSEGGAILVLKKLEDAIAEGNRIFAVVAATAVNCDGRTNGLTVPSAQAQAALLREAYARAGIDPAAVDYVEAHGTGTAVGDPIEAAALGAALGKARPPGSPLRIGSVKTNVGHMEAAAGMAGIVKAVHCLRHRMLPPSLHFESPNPRIPFAALNLEVVREPQPLPQAKTLVIGVNSFGFGGANGHVVLESAPENNGERVRPPETGAPLVVTGHSPTALKAAAAQFAQWLRRREDLGLYEIAYSAAFHRDWHPHRAIFPAAGRGALAEALDRFAAGDTPADVAVGRALAAPAGPVFVYSGNGSQWAGMGRALFAEDPVFRAAVEDVDRLFARHRGASVIEWMASDTLGERLESTEVAQPLLFAVQAGITEMLRACGIAPSAAVGHSVGEIAAAWACGALTLEQAVEVVAQRSAWQETTRGAGAMTAVQLGEGDMRAFLAASGMSERIELAAVNSPRSVTVAGRATDLDALEAGLREHDIAFTRLGLDYAFHSRAMDAIEQNIERSLAHLRPSPARIPFWSAVAGAQLEGDQLDSRYWWRNIREPVRFEQAIRGLRESGATVFVEIGPRPILAGYVRECLGEAARQSAILPTMAPKADDLASVRRRAFEILIAGCPTDLERLFPAKAPFVELPGYPWQRERHWYEPTPESLGLLERRPAHPLLGYRLHRDLAEWENRLDTRLIPALAEHRVGGEAVFPASGFVEMALAAAAQIYGGTIREVEDLAIHAPLVLDPEHSKTVRLAVDLDDGRFFIRSRTTASEEAWRVHATGRLPAAASLPAPTEAVASPETARTVASEDHYRVLADAGLDYGPAFRQVREIRVSAECVDATLGDAPAVCAQSPVELDPAALDACFQLLLHLLPGQSAPRDEHAFLPVGVGHLQLIRPGERATHARMIARRRGHRSVAADCRLYGADGSCIAALREVRFRAVPLRDGAARLVALREHAIPMPLAELHARAALPSIAELQAACAARLHTAARLAARRRYYSTVEPLLEAMMSAFARDAVHALAGSSAPASADVLLASGAVPLAAARKLERLIQFAGNGELPESGQLWTDLIGEHPDHAGEIIRLGRIGRHLPELIKGTLTLGTLFPGESDALIPGPAADFAEALGAIVAKALDALPAAGRLRVLLAGAPGPELAGAVLAALDARRADCVVACRDPRARESLAAAFSHRYTAAIVEHDFARPGELAPELRAPFDIVFYDARGTGAEAREAVLAHLHARMASEGLLALFEPVPSRTATLVAGLIDPPAAETGRAAQEPPCKAWSNALERCGFVPQATLGDVPTLEAGPFVILARTARAASEAPQAHPTPPDAGHWILLSAGDGWSSEFGARLAVELVQRGRLALHVRQAPHEPVCWPRLLEESRARHGDIAGVVDLRAIGAEAKPLPPSGMLERQIERCVSLGELFETCGARQALRPACWIVTARAASALVPAEARGSAREATRSDDAAVWGFARVATNEYAALALRVVDLAEPENISAMARALADCLLHDDGEDETILTSQGRFAARLEAGPVADPAHGEKAAARDVRRLELPSPGQVRHLAWIRRRLPALGDDEVEIEVRAAGLNFRDIMFSIGQLSEEAMETGFAGPTLGMELSGTVAAVGQGVRGLRVGDRVAAFAASSFSDRVITKASTVLKIPESWSFEAAATVPTAFLTAYYALTHLAHLAEGERVLIHGAAGGVGLAAAQIAQLAGAEIFATAGTEAKRDVLRLLGVNHVFNSRTLDFAGEVLARTNGKGVDVILNSLAGEAMVRSLHVLKPLGRFLELGKRDYYANTRIGLRPFRNNISYFGIDVDQLMLERPVFVRRMMRDLLTLFEEGSLRPLPYRAFAARDAVDAFRFMQQSRHIGKVVLAMGALPRTVAAPPAGRAALRLNGDATYLVTGGLGGLGLRTARWLADRGARHLVLVGRSGAQSETARAGIAALEARGVRVLAEACDIADFPSVQRLHAKVHATLPPLRGVVHAAGVIEDGLIRKLSREQWRAVFEPKVLGALNLDRITRGARLDFFVLFSSATTALGNPGQANYVAANRFLEALADRRRAAGEPALCIAWGPVEDAGYLARNAQVRERLVARTGSPALRAADLLDTMERLLAAGAAENLAVMKAGRSGLGRLSAPRARRFASLAPLAADAAAPAAETYDIARWLDELDDEGLAARLADLLKKEVAEILRIPAERLDAAQPLQELGMDSLMGVELMTAVESRFGISIPALAIAEVGSIEKLAARLAKELRRSRAGHAHAPADDLLAQASRLAAQYARDLSRDEAQAIAAAIEELRPASGEVRAP